MSKEIIILGLVFVLVCLSGCATNALYEAASQGNIKSAKKLLEEGVDPYSSIDSYINSTPMSAAIYHGHNEIVELFLEGATRRQKEMVLSLVAREGNLDIVKKLVLQGVNVNSRNSYGTPALESAATAIRFNYSFGHTSSQPAKVGYMALPSGGAVPIAIPSDHRNDVFNLSIDKRKPGGQFVKTVEFLLENGADVNIKGYYNVTPLHKATIYLSRRAIDGYSEEAISIVKILIDYGADVNAKNETGDTPLHYAVLFDEISFIKSELRLGLDVRLTGFGSDAEIPRNQSDVKYERLISLNIVDPSQKEIVALLLNNGADINATNNEGNTPLHDASDNGLLDIVGLLLERGAKSNLQNNNGKTPLDLAGSRGHYEILKILENHSAIN